MGSWLGSFPLTGDGHSSDTVDHTVPTALSQDPHAVILKIPEPIRTAREHFHFSVEALGNPGGLREAPSIPKGLQKWGD